MPVKYGIIKHDCNHREDIILETVFEIMGIENKEVKVSNLFAYFIKQPGHKFLNLLCELAEISPVELSCPITVKREFYFQLDGYDNKKIS